MLQVSAFAAMVMRIVYGIELREHDDRYYQMVERMAQVGEEISVPGRFPVESVPLLRFLPSWFPGGGYKKFAADAKGDIHFAISNLFDTAKAATVSASIEDTDGSIVDEQCGCPGQGLCPRILRYSASAG